MTNGCVVKVWFDEDQPERRANYVLVETDYPDFEAFLQVVDADRMICGTQLDTKWTDAEKYCRTIWRRVPIAFRGSTVRRAMLPTWRLVEEV